MHIHMDTKSIAANFWGNFPNNKAIPAPVEYKIGARVKIINGPCSLDGAQSYHGRYVGYYGEIIRLPELSCSCSDEEPIITIGVLLDNKRNERSQYGCFWFKPAELIVIEKENTNMLLLKPYKMAKVDIEGFGDQYVAHYEENLEEGNGVVIVSDGRYRCGVVVSADITNKSFDPTWQVVCKIDDDAYLDRCNRAERADQIKKELSRAAKEYHEIALFEMMAEKSPAIAELLKEYKEITNA